MSFLRDTVLFKQTAKRSSSTPSIGTSTNGTSTSPTEPSPLSYTSCLNQARMLRPKSEFSTERAVLLLQRYWMLQKQRKELSKMFHQRRNIILEIVKTEETYVNDLKTIVEVFHKPIQKKELIPAKQIGTIFQHISMIYKLNETMLTKLQVVRTQQLEMYEHQKRAVEKPGMELEVHSQEENRRASTGKSVQGSATFLTIIKPDKNKRKKNKQKSPRQASPSSSSQKDNISASKSIGDVFKETVPFMKLYTQYINNYDDIIATVRECRKENQALDKYLKECKKSRPECRGMDINSFLILPVQRIPRYQLLLRELIKNTPQSYKDYSPLERSYAEIVSVATHLNNMKRKKEALMTTLTVQKRIASLSTEYTDLMNSDGKNANTKEVADKLELYKRSLVAPNRHYVDDVKIQLTFKSGDKQTNVDKWRPYHAYIYNDLLIFVIEPNNQMDEDEEYTNTKTIEENLRAPLLVQSLYFAFAQVVDSELSKDNILEIQYYVGDQTYYLKFKDADSFSKIFVTLRNEIQEELTKLHSSLVDKNVDEEEDEEKRVQLATEKLKDLRKTIKMKFNASGFLADKKSEYLTIYKKLQETCAEYDKYYTKLKLSRNIPEQDQITKQKEILELENAMDQLEPLMKECFARLKHGQETLENYVSQILVCDKVLFTCLRDNKESFSAIFGSTEDYLQGLEFNKVSLSELKYNGKMSDRNKSKMSANGAIAVENQQRPKTMNRTDPVMSQQIMDQIFAIQEEKRVLQERVVDLEKQLEQKKILFDNSIKERRRLAQDLEELSKKQNEESPKDEAHIQELLNKIVGLESSMVQLNTEIEQLQNENRELANDLNATKADSQNKLEELMKEKNNHISLLESNVENLTTSNNALKNINNELKSNLELSQKSYNTLSSEFSETKLSLLSTIEDLKIEVSQAKNQMRRAQKKYKQITSDSLKGPLQLSKLTQPVEEEPSLSKQLMQHSEYIKLERQVADLESKAKEQQDYKKKYEEIQVQLLKEQRKVTQVEIDYESKIKAMEIEMAKLKRRNQDLELVSRSSTTEENHESKRERSQSVRQKAQIFQQHEPQGLPPVTPRRRLSSGSLSTSTQQDTKLSEVESELNSQKKLVEALNRELDEQTKRADKYEKLLQSIKELTHEL